MSRAAAVANRLLMAGARPAARRFDRASRDPRGAQRAILLRILRENAASAVGRRLGFADIRTEAEYRTRVPVRPYDALEPEIARVAGGEGGILTTAPVVCFEPTGGSTGGTRLIPYTRRLLREFSAATLPWIHDLLSSRPALRRGRAYWAVTPPARGAAATAGGVPIGLDGDGDYFPGLAGLLLERVVGTPRVLAGAPDVERWRRLTLRALLAMDDLAFVSVWSPSFLTLLADALDEAWPALLDDLETGAVSVPLDGELRARAARELPARPGRARALRRRFGGRAPDDLGALWPGLSLISCWTDAHAARMVPGLRARFPGVELQGKGLLATEGVVSFPVMEAGGAVAAVSSHYLEFVPAGSDGGGVRERDAAGVADLEVGASYEVLLTTSGGLYRYPLRDVVRVEGWYRSTPVLSFLGRADGTSDLAGEKLSPAFVESVLREAAAAAGATACFAMLAPAPGDPPRYDLLVDCDPAAAERLARAVEDGLQASAPYAVCRRLGQLGPVRPAVVPDAARRYEEACVARGQRIGTVKPMALGTHWGDA